MNSLKDKHIAVVGVSQNEKKFGHKIFRDLMSSGFKVTPVHPAGGEVLGRKVFRSIRDLAERPDLVITVVTPSVTEKIVSDSIELGIPEIWMQPGSESDAAIEEAKKHGIKVTHSACFMVLHKVW